MRVATQVRSAHEAIQDHPYAGQSGYNGPIATLMGTEAFARMAEFQGEILRDHNRNPIDLLVGDDVSGRIPTLMTHRFLRMALAGGYARNAPATIFMTSGKAARFDLSPAEQNEVEKQWANNLTDHAEQMIGRFSVRNVLVLTEIVGEGDSMRRLKGAFETHGAIARHEIFPYGFAFYLRGMESGSVYRQSAGVEKYPPEAVTRRHPKFNGEDASRLRHFLDDYTEALYIAVFSEAPNVEPIRRENVGGGSVLKRIKSRRRHLPRIQRNRKHS